MSRRSHISIGATAAIDELPSDPPPAANLNWPPPRNSWLGGVDLVVLPPGWVLFLTAGGALWSTLAEALAGQ